MSISKEAVEAAAHAMCDDGCNWDNELPGRRKTMWLDRAEISLRAALPFLAHPAPSQSEGRKMIWNDGRACWLFPDGSHRGITKADAEQITHWQEHLAAVRAEATLAGAAAEREACAKLIEENSILFCSEGLNQLRPRMDGDRTGLDYATAIRARA